MNKLLAVFLALAAPGFVFAEGVYDLGDIKVEEAGYVYGINDFGKSTVTFKGGAIVEGGPANAADLFGGAAGVFFESGGIINSTVGSYGMFILKIRGQGELPNSGILTLIDDRPQSVSVFRHQLLDTLALDCVDSMEIIKGPSGVENGNQAAAGVISLKTKSMEKEGMKTIVKASVGNYFTQDYSVNNMMKTGPFDYVLSAGYKSTQGIRERSDSYQQNYGLKAGFDISREFRLAGSACYDDILFFNPGPEGAIAWAADQEACLMRHLAGDVRLENDIDGWKGKAMVYAETGGNEFLKSTSPVGVTIPGTDIYYRNYGARIMQEKSFFEGNMLKAGFDWQNFGGHFINYPPMPSMKRDVTASENDYAPYAILSQKIGIAGLSLGARYGINSKWGNEFVPQAGLTVSVIEGLKAYANVSKGYRTPAMGTVIFAEYDALAPEIFWQYEAGFQHELGKLLSYTVSFYQTEAQNLLRDTDPSSMVTYLENTGFALIRGMEAGAEFKPLDSLGIGASVSYNEPGNASARTALLSGKASVHYSVLKELGLKLEAEFARDRYNADYKAEKLDDYIIFNAGIKYKADIAGLQTDLYLDVNNMLDTKYVIKTVTAPALIAGDYKAAGFIVKGGIVLKI